MDNYLHCCEAKPKTSTFPLFFRVSSDAHLPGMTYVQQEVEVFENENVVAFDLLLSLGSLCQ